MTDATCDVIKHYNIILRSVTGREYGKADKRFLVSDPTIVSMAMPTVAVCGPLCVALIYSIIRQRAYRHWLQVALCVCELYGGQSI